MRKLSAALICAALLLVVAFSVTKNSPINQQEATTIAISRLKDFAEQNNIDDHAFMTPEVRREKFWEFYYSTKDVTPKYDVAIFVYDDRGSEIKFMKGQ